MIRTKYREGKSLLGKMQYDQRRELKADTDKILEEEYHLLVVAVPNDTLHSADDLAVVVVDVIQNVLKAECTVLKTSENLKQQEYEVRLRVENRIFDFSVPNNATYLEGRDIVWELSEVSRHVMQDNVSFDLRETYGADSIQLVLGKQDDVNRAIEDGFPIHKKEFGRIKWFSDMR